jgi:hypothetical protein
MTILGPISTDGLFLVICGRQIHRLPSIACGGKSHTLLSATTLSKIFLNTEQAMTWMNSLRYC